MGDCEKYSKTLEILSSYSVTWEQLEFTRFHIISLELFSLEVNGKAPDRPNKSVVGGGVIIVFLMSMELEKVEVAVGVLQVVNTHPS